MRNQDKIIKISRIMVKKRRKANQLRNKVRKITKRRK